MFDLEKSIAEWRKEMFAGGIKPPELLDELEGHLRETIERRMRLDPDAHRAFDAAVAEIGRAAALKTEFAKTGGTLFERAGRAILELAGTPNLQLATNMNTNTSNNFESGWSTYLKAATFAFPAAFLWMFSAVFLLPKVNEICQRAGTVTFALPQAPMVFRALGRCGKADAFADQSRPPGDWYRGAGAGRPGMAVQGLVALPAGHDGNRRRGA
jgi:hypothetical protein